MASLPNFALLFIVLGFLVTYTIFFSAGMDAQVSYAFHSERKQHPEKFKNQLVNQVRFCLHFLLSWCMIKHKVTN